MAGWAGAAEDRLDASRATSARVTLRRAEFMGLLVRLTIVSSLGVAEKDRVERSLASRVRFRSSPGDVEAVGTKIARRGLEGFRAEATLLAEMLSTRIACLR